MWRHSKASADGESHRRPEPLALQRRALAEEEPGGMPPESTPTSSIWIRWKMDDIWWVHPGGNSRGPCRRKAPPQKKLDPLKYVQQVLKMCSLGERRASWTNVFKVLSRVLFAGRATKYKLRNYWKHVMKLISAHLLRYFRPPATNLAKSLSIWSKFRQRRPDGKPEVSKCWQGLVEIGGRRWKCHQT